MVLCWGNMEGYTSYESLVGDYSPAAVSEKLGNALEDESFRFAFDQELNRLNYDVSQVLEENFLDTLDESRRQEICSHLGSIHLNGVTPESVHELAQLFND